MDHRVEVVIINWNTKQLLDECLASVYEHGCAYSFQVTVVDNASSDGSPEMVEEKYPQVHLIRNTQNVGFAKANNQAFASSQADYYLLLNSDTFVTAQALTALIDAMENDPTLGALGPELPQPQGTLKAHSCGYLPTIPTVFAHYFGLTRLPFLAPRIKGFHLLPGQVRAKLVEVEWLSGACLVVRRQVVEQCGPLDEKYFMYAEDLEWCQRIARGGWRIGFLPESVVFHYIGASDDQADPSTKWVENLVNFYRRDHSRLHARILALIFAIGLLARGGVAVARYGLTKRRPWRQRSRVLLKSGFKSLSLTRTL